MYSSVLPSYSSDKDGKGNKKEKIINADDPKNIEKVNNMLLNDE